MKKNYRHTFRKTSNQRNDGSRRWFVFITACTSMMLDIGFMFSFGTLYVNIMTTYSASRSEAAMVQSILMAVRFGTGMISGTMVQKVGTCYAGMFGTCIAAVGLVVSFFASSVIILDICIGVILAFGSSCLYIASSIAIGQHFSGEKRHILLSVQSAAGGLGGMIFPYFLKYLSDTFGLRGTFLIVGGVYLQLLPASLLWRENEQATSKTLPNEGTEIDTNTIHGEQNDIDADSLLSKYEESVSIDGYDSSVEVADRNDESNKLAIHLKSVDGNENEIPNSVADGEIKLTDSLHEPDRVKQIYEREAHKSENAKGESIGQCLKNLALDPCFVLFAIGLAIAYPALGILFIFIVDLFIDAGLSEEDATFGLLLVHMFSIVGRLLPGIVMQSKHVPSLSVPIFASVVTSACMTGLVAVTGLKLHLLLLGLIGIPYGVFVSVFNVTTLKIVGIDKLSSAVGVHFTLNGIGSALAGPISGSLRDKTGTYTYPFGIASGVILVGAMFFTASLLIRRKRNRELSERTPLLANNQLLFS